MGLSGKIDAIKRLRELRGKPEIIPVNTDLTPQGEFHFKVNPGYIGLKEAKDLVELIQAWAVEDFQNGGGLRHNSIVGVTVEELRLPFSNIRDAVAAARSDVKIYKIILTESNGYEVILWRNNRTSALEIDLI